MPRKAKPKKRVARRKQYTPPPVKPALLDESYLVKQLELPILVQNLQLIRHAAPNALLDAYDRGATREFLIDMIRESVALNELLSRLQLLDILGKMDVSEADAVDKLIRLPTERVYSLIVDMTKSAEETRKNVVEMAKLLVEMPQEIDPIN